jgi:hypothetical protein
MQHAGGRGGIQVRLPGGRRRTRHQQFCRDCCQNCDGWAAVLRMHAAGPVFVIFVVLAVIGRANGDTMR